MSTVCNYEHIAVILVSTVMKNDTVLDVMTFTHAATAPHTTLPGTFKLPTVERFRLATFRTRDYQKTNHRYVRLHAL